MPDYQSFDDRLKRQLLRDEGCVLHAYHDSEGWLTIGIGRLVDQKKGGGITREEAMYLLGNDLHKVYRALDERLSWWSELSEPRRAVLVNMAFNLGIDGLLGFKNFLRCVREQRFMDAGAEMLDSKWALQVGSRARRLADQMMRDEWQ